LDNFIGDKRNIWFMIFRYMRSSANRRKIDTFF